MTDDLNQPLGHDGGERAARRSVLSGRALARTAVLLVAAGAAGLALLPRDPYGGEPHAVARIEQPKAPAEPLMAELAQPGGTLGGRGLTGADQTPPGQRGPDRVASAAELEQQSGVKITRTGGGDASGALIIQIDRPSGVKMPPAPDRRVVEKGRYGPLPRIGAGGARPMDVYARPFVSSPKLKADAPRIALVVGGVGLNPQSSAQAIEELPEAVTLAFAPYGANLDALAARARDSGHEALLQAPMEPFDYPQNNPGPHTLLTGAQDSGDLDDLHWLMSRFSGYAGIMNFMGARFTSDEKALAPALAEIAQRGLFFLDDGSAPQSLVPTLAPRYSLPAARVDVIIDARSTPQSVDAALAQLEVVARQKGSAIGFANAVPATIARLARFARDLERRGVVLAPVSSTLRAAGASSAEAGGGPRR
jgi:polysaccharide deacetylase 2 family uncharacterized protein YibQ